MINRVSKLRLKEVAGGGNKILLFAFMISSGYFYLCIFIIEVLKDMQSVN